MGALITICDRLWQADGDHILKPFAIANMSQRIWEPEATQRLRQLLSISQEIALRKITSDRYGRTVAEAYRDGKSVG